MCVRSNTNPYLFVHKKEKKRRWEHSPTHTELENFANTKDIQIHINTMVPIGHPGAPHNMHGPPHSMPSMPSAPSGPNTLSTNQSNKGASSVVSTKCVQFCDLFRKNNEIDYWHGALCPPTQECFRFFFAVLSKKHWSISQFSFLFAV